MTAVDDQKRSAPPATATDVAPDLTVICPYLVSADGSWRSTTAAREHRCGAVAPPAILAAEKQRRLCLTDDHLRCATYEAARAARPIAQDRAATLPRPLVRTTPVVLDHGRITITMPALPTERVPAQAILIVLLAIAFAAIVLARLTGGGSLTGAVAGASASPTPRAAVLASASAHPPTSQPSRSVEPSVAPSALAASAPPATARPPTKATRTYKVKAGDTLIGIAAKYKTTVSAIRKLNHLTSSSRLHIGQILKIP